jgi:2-methylcitrate dehydratase PrpD
VASHSETLARFATDPRPADLPDGVVAQVKRHRLDVLGVALAAALRGAA